MAKRSNPSTEQHPHFPSGEWEGFYLQFGTEHKMLCQLTFKNGQVSGTCQDAVGASTWKGTYDAQAGTCQMVKSYKTHEVTYKGLVDENGYWGKWTILGWESGFHIWPRKTAKGSAKVEQESIKKEKAAPLKTKLW